jgi:hypothetical protein
MPDLTRAQFWSGGGVICPTTRGLLSVNYETVPPSISCDCPDHVGKLYYLPALILEGINA